MSTSSTTPANEGSRGRTLLLLVIAVVGTAFFVVEHRMTAPFDHAEEKSLSTRTSTLDVNVSEGSLDRQLGFASLGALGCLLLLKRSRNRLGFNNSLAWLMLGSITFCVLSVVWADDPSLTLKRVFIPVLCFLLVLGVGKHLTLREISITALVVSLAFLMIGIGAEVRLGTFPPTSSASRFCGTVHPNSQGINCACICIASFCLYRSGSRARFVLIGCFLLGLTFLLLTKSRTSLGAFVCAMAACSALRMTWRGKSLALTWLPAAACCLLLFAAIQGIDIQKTLTRAVLMGRESQAESLTGRLPLWETVVTFIQERPFMGYGYGSFWSAERIQRFRMILGWEMDHAHSSYLELTLSLGIIGAGILLALVVQGTRRAANLFRATGDGGAAFLFTILTMGLVHSLCDTGFAKPSFVVAVTSFGLAVLAFGSPARSTPQSV